ncbi:MAG: Glutamyl-tRNA synthetase [Candidatus Ozemobacter sibiricus]|jgi:glutamyl-tRNA synthetase|uniref:Glutamate--tRNA ligase n=1 Tax=Candidatus Ozemobacter sibiricus TaxID=2268124 RepID=A0A367ZQD3_9BACT|nr:MAG: Glutamyl-tRNA synthetase [Candidatus Ozemobacter sibiricus]
MSTPVRVRFAPSPTGHLHVGGARTALFNWLFARHYRGVFVLRIEDTDLERSQEAYTKAILDGLRWLGLDWDEGPDVGGPHGPYFQSQREDRYRAAIERLLHEGKLYHCFCTAETLEAMRKDQAERKVDIKYDGRCRALDRAEVERRIAAGETFVLRLRRPEREWVEWDDITKGRLSFTSDQLDDLVVVKSDGMPTYNFAVVVDDIDMRITHVIRGEDHISNTPKQILLYRALGAPLPWFAHIPMILGKDRARLSKRHGATSVVEYEKMGYDPEAFRNYLALLGWAPTDHTREILSRDELFAEFTLDRVSSHGAIFDLDKLTWMNAEYIKRFSPATLLAKLRPWLAQIPGFPGGLDEPALVKLAGLYRERLKTYNEILTMADWFFTAPTTYDAKGLEKAAKIGGARGLLNRLLERLRAAPEFAEGPLEALVRSFAEAEGRKFGDVVHLCRLGLSGRTATPGLFEVMAVLGRDRCLARLERFAAVCPT